MRTALVVSYNGNGYHGWQAQPNAIPTIQEELTGAVSRVADHPVRIICAGRTDAKVHATKQVVHFDAESDRSETAWIRGVNTYLGSEIKVQAAIRVPPHFDARRSALSRRYLYLINNSEHPSSLMHHYLTQEARKLDSNRMHLAGQSLLGENDFSSFRAANCQSLTPMRNLLNLSVSRWADVVVIDVRANAFLQHMVRNIAGALIEVGTGRKEPDWLKGLLASKDRTVGPKTASPNGLFLVDVEYSESTGIPSGPNLPHFFQFYRPD
jgi:tRNA pseudouridine38-40 synthase